MECVGECLVLFSTCWYCSLLGQAKPTRETKKTEQSTSNLVLESGILIEYAVQVHNNTFVLLLFALHLSEAGITHTDCLSQGKVILEEMIGA